jgi:hypothetical protein
LDVDIADAVPAVVVAVVVVVMVVVVVVVMVLVVVVVVLVMVVVVVVAAAVQGLASPDDVEVGCCDADATVLPPHDRVRVSWLGEAVGGVRVHEACAIPRHRQWQASA